MIPQDQQIIKECIEKTLEKMGIFGSVEILQRDSILSFNIRTEDSAILIGQHGVNLRELQYLVRILTARKLSSPQPFLVDIEDYRKGREEYLREVARQAARRVQESGASLLLKPMSPYERRIVHTELQNFEDVESRSQGEDPERRILIKKIS